MQRDHMLGLAAYDPGPSFDAMSQRVFDDLIKVYTKSYDAPPMEVQEFNAHQFLNPDGTYTPTPAQALELARRLMEQEIQARKSEAQTNAEKAKAFNADRNARALALQQQMEAVAHKVKQEHGAGRAQDMGLQALVGREAPDTGPMAQGQLWMGGGRAGMKTALAEFAAQYQPDPGRAELADAETPEEVWARDHYFPSPEVAQFIARKVHAR